MTDELPAQQFTGVFIPAHIWNDPRLNCVYRCLWAEIHALGGQSGRCFASNEYLGKTIGVSADRVSRMLAELIEWELVQVVSFNGRVRYLKTFADTKADLVKIPMQTRQKNQGSIGENTNLDKKKLRIIKEKEEIIIPSELQGDDFKASWERWLQYRREKKKPVTPSTAHTQFQKAIKMGKLKAIRAIEIAIDNSWASFFEPKDYQMQESLPNLSSPGKPKKILREASFEGDPGHDEVMRE